jgi:hypothetical protein
MELSKQKNYQQSFDLACASIKGMNLEERAKKAGADYQKGEDGEKITLHFFSEPYHIQFPQIEFYSPPKKVVSLVTRILLLHYLIRADGNPLTGKWVAYKDIPGGLLYAGVFARRVTEPSCFPLCASPVCPLGGRRRVSAFGPASLRRLCGPLPFFRRYCCPWPGNYR